SARALADDLQRFLDNQPITARPVGATERALKWARRKPAVAALSVGLTLTLVVGFALVSFLYVQANQQRQAAEEERRQAVEAREREQRLAEAAREGEAREKKLATAEKSARQQAEMESLRAQRLAVTGFLERGRNLCEQG